MLMAGAAGCSTTPAPWYRQQIREFTATVTAMEREQRLLSLQDESGVATTLYVGPEIRNYEQIKVGDRVVATYQEAIAAAVTRPDQAVKEPQISAATERAEAGQLPHAEVSASMVATVAIEAVDTQSSMVTFRRNDGHVRTVRVEDEGAKKFIQGLKQGDLVTVTYTEALAISLRPLAVM
jgi:translation initiation factor IF-1